MSSVIFLLTELAVALKSVIKSKRSSVLKIDFYGKNLFLVFFIKKTKKTCF